MTFPPLARKHIGFALKAAQFGEKPPDAKVLKGFGGAGVLEIVEDYDGNAYRVVYTVRFSEAICVLHSFQKKSKTGVATPKKELELVRERYEYARYLHSKGLL
jgi:phage-related protein